MGKTCIGQKMKKKKKKDETYKSLQNSGIQTDQKIPASRPNIKFINKDGDCGANFITVGNGHGYPSSNPKGRYLHFT